MKMIAAIMIGLVFGVSIAQGSGGLRTFRTEEIRIRDPFILPVRDEGKYYMYGTCTLSGEPGFDAYVSTDLEVWKGAYPVFRPQPGFRATRDFWAPEVYLYRGRYYMFASMKAQGACRGTQILVADSPLGPFQPHGDGPATPREWECLDGTLFLDEADHPYMVFCHEWVQGGDGSICAVSLTEDLKEPSGAPTVLFHASSAPWVGQPAWSGTGKYVTDGPWLHRAKNGELLMLWSSFDKTGTYAVALARAASGTITGPWELDPEPIFAKHGGHGMLFRDFGGELFLSIHVPNSPPPERPVFLRVAEIDGKLKLPAD